MSPASIDFALTPFQSPAVVLIGPPGVGKSTIGQMLASRLNWSFIDTDVVIEAKTQKRIAQIFADDGEETFRTFESEVLASLCAAKRETTKSDLARLVVATGAGLPVKSGHLERLQSLGYLICLSAPLEVLAQRLADAKDRPLLNKNSSSLRKAQDATSGEILSRLELILEARKQIYERAKYVIETNQRSTSEITEQIVDLMAHPS